MINKALDQIGILDLRELIQNKVAEGKTIEYKQISPGGKDADKKEFLADASSFANASGGNLIFGILAESGIPKEIVPLQVDFDKEILRLENILRDGIEPRMQFAAKQVGDVIVLHIPKSWNGPHRVIYQGWDKFYGRTSNGKYPLDTGELRSAFNLSESLNERIRNFKVERIMAIRNGDLPVPFYQSPKIVLHLIPLSAFTPGMSVNAAKIDPGCLQPIYCSGWNHRLNLDGYLTYSEGRENKSRSYTQFFRTGIIEAAEGSILEPKHEGKKMIASIAYEKEIIHGLARYLRAMNMLGIEPPICLFLTFIDVKGYGMTASRWEFDDNYPIDRDILDLPDILVEDMDERPEKILRPLFDMIWNACGYERSFNYDEEGNWKPR
jgi:hypothetical protein